MFQKILLAYDGSEGAKKALETGINLVKIHQAELWAVTVQEKLPRYGGTIDEVQEEKEVVDAHYGKIVEQVRARAQEAGIEIKVLRPFGHPARTIVEIAKEGQHDLILMGHRGVSGVWAAFLGTTAEKVSRHAPCSVLIVR
ncbi:universal stress protein [Desulfobacca acetoxidans]|uniref:UspA domain-containing protein n=1 Tax=Desulfobacca acetoxidans (strain ATCC 700848 / DSM 11109 / ASRB2) TaxID=880072 RepID=F2NDZ7_DESAR|nr:universal stress protein [Desulfobacca acetoxidans]AEB10565.1 UspA domain-containing protein [Desulfobacca acetoxidans DSM 11109]